MGITILYQDVQFTRLHFFLSFYFIFIFDNFRFPTDPSDRIWKSESNSGPTTKPLQGGDAKVVNYIANVGVPLEVLQTALTDPNRLDFPFNDLDTGDFKYRVILYFLELDKTVQPGARLFDIYINNDKKETRFDILGNGSNYKELSFDVRANKVLNLSLVKASGSSLGPICNAYEIFRVFPWKQETVSIDGKFKFATTY